jgi:aryl-alcohol dehydrogenase-like predicted oxidoreductase
MNMKKTNNTKLRELGQTGIQISPIGLGCLQFSEGKGGAWNLWDPVSEKEKNRIVQAALDGGMNWFDTAELYGMGRSERGLARSLKLAGKNDKEVIVATKWSPIARTARSITKTIGKRQENLNDYTVDLFQIHMPFAFTTRRAEMNAMAGLVKSGEIRSVGVSNYSAKQMRKAHEVLQSQGLSLASNQVKYNLVDRRIESNGILDTAKELGITIIAWGPVCFGLLSGRFHKNSKLIDSVPLLRRLQMRSKIEPSRKLVNELEEIGRAHDVTAAQVALNWLINFHGDTVVAIPGSSKVHQAEQNADAMSFDLANAEMSHIDDLTKQFL